MGLISASVMKDTLEMGFLVKVRNTVSATVSATVGHCYGINLPENVRAIRSFQSFKSEINPLMSTSYSHTANM